MLCGRHERCDVRVTNVAEHGIEGVTCTVTTKREVYEVAIPSPGAYMIYPAAMAIAIGEHLGLTKAEMLAGIAAYRPVGSRMHLVRCSNDRIIIDDCYNANPQAMAEALRILAQTEHPRRMAVLGDMGELGDLTEQAHRDMGTLARTLGLNTVVAICHDRYFLDRTVSRVIEVLDGKAEFYSGNYSFYAVEKERRYQERMKQYLKEQAKIQQLEKAAEQMHLWAFMGNDALHKRAFSMEKRIERMRTTAKPTKAKKMDARFASREFKGDEVLQFRGVTKAFDERTLFSDVYLRVEGGERIALIGENGTGKTTLLNMLTGRESCDGGSIRLGPSVKWAYLEQVIHFDHPERNLVDTMLYAKKNITPQSARNRLAAYQFQGEDVFKSVSVLSGGELSRLRLCMLMDEEINFLILDEPTNHLDIASREWIEEAVEAFDGTLLFVSHDRYFINRFATRIWELADGTITDYPMGFAQYRAMKAAEPKPEPAAPVKKGDTRQSRGNRSQQAARRQLTICETGIARLEKELAALDEAMAANACDAGRLNELFTQKQETEARLEQEMARWEELSLALEES